MFISLKSVDKIELFKMIKNDERLQEILFDKKISGLDLNQINSITKIAHSYYESQFADDNAKTKYKAAKISIQDGVDNKVVFVDDFGVFEWDNKQMSYKLIPEKTQKYQQYFYNKFGDNYLTILKDYSNEVLDYQLGTINTALYFENLIQKRQKDAGLNMKVKDFSDNEITLTKLYREKEQEMRSASFENLANQSAIKVK